MSNDECLIELHNRMQKLLEDDRYYTDLVTQQHFCCVDDPYGNQRNPYPVPPMRLCQQASGYGVLCG